jgi:tetratricopeptide (TPR) repeat protein
LSVKRQYPFDENAFSVVGGTIMDFGTGRRSFLGWPQRAFLAVLLLALAGLATGLFRTPTVWLRQVHHREPALDHVAAAAAQQGQPTTATESLARIDHDLPIARQQADAGPRDWSSRAAVGDLLLARARLTGSFDDYTASGQAYDQAATLAPAGSGPHFERATWNFSVHRLDAMTADLDALDHYALPDDALVAGKLGLRGDQAFYRGQYADALHWYGKAQSRMATLGGDFRLANYYARMGEPDRALDMLQQGEDRVTGPQQQMLGFIEMRRGMIEMGRGDWTKAEAHFRRSEDIFPGTWLVAEQLATVRALQGHPEEAMAIFRRMATLGLPDAYDGMAGLARAHGDFAQSRAYATQADTLWRRRMAQLPEAAYGHALDHLLAFGDPAEALLVAKRNYAARPYADSATGLAWAFLANHRAQEALAAIQPTLASGWTVAEPHVVASEAYALLGQGKQADAERAAALAINPHSFDRNPGMTWLEQ